MTMMVAMARCSPATVALLPLPLTFGAGVMPLRLPRHLKLGQRSYFFGSGAVNATQGGRRFPTLRVHARALLVDEVDDEQTSRNCSGFYEKAFLTTTVALIPLLDVETANAAGGEFGLLEGRSSALLHPIVMGGLLAYTLYAGYLGWQWRRVRTIQTDINELKKQVSQIPVAAGEKSAAPPPPSPIETQISALTEERKELVKGGFKDKHFYAGSILLGLGTLTSVGGALNTWFRTGKLFPGPHLFAGAGITICWALAAALVPSMQKGSETARNLHIGLNVINVALFVWQIPTGWEIVGKVLEFTTWP